MQDCDGFSCMSHGRQRIWTGPKIVESDYEAWWKRGSSKLDKGSTRVCFFLTGQELTIFNLLLNTHLTFFMYDLYLQCKGHTEHLECSQNLQYFFTCPSTDIYWWCWLSVIIGIMLHILALRLDQHDYSIIYIKSSWIKKNNSLVLIIGNLLGRSCSKWNIALETKIAFHTRVFSRSGVSKVGFLFWNGIFSTCRGLIVHW